MPEQPDPPIIITGGSVTIEFDPRTFLDTGKGTYSNEEKVIQRVEISGEGIRGYAEDATGNDITIKITYGTP
jgi:hypothetical protein